MDLVNHLDELANAKGTVSARAAHLSDQEIYSCFEEFLAQNHSAWISHFEMDIDKCSVTSLSSRDFSLDLKLILGLVTDVPAFWATICQLGHRDPQTLQQNQDAAVYQALNDFCLDLSRIGVNMTPEELFKIVQDNKIAIELRMLEKLTVQIPLPENSRGQFWDHMESMFNLIHPYDQICFQNNKNDQFVSTIMQKMNSLGPELQSEQINPMDVINNIFSDKQFINSVGNIMKGDENGQFNPMNIMGMFGKLFQAMGVPQ